MAFTFSHTVVAPLIYRCSKQQLPFAALVIGTMLPDLARVIFHSPINHHFLGMFTINLFCGLCFYFSWTQFYRPVTYVLFEKKLAPQAQLNIKTFLLICIALFIGNFSHLLWDSFTHLDDRTWFGHDFLASTIQISNLNMPMHRFLQYSTSFLALPFLYFFIREFQHLESLKSDSPYLNKKLNVIYISLCLFATLLISAGYLYFFSPISQLSIYALIVISFKVFALTALALFSLLYLLIHQHLKRLSAISTCDTTHK